MASPFDESRPEMRRLSGEIGRILIVEDYADLANVTARLLLHCGFDTKAVYDGRSAIAAALDFRPHSIPLDIHLPGVGGYELAAMIRAEHRLKDVVVIGVSAYRPVAQSEFPVDAYFDHHLVKPIELEDLLALIKPG